MRRKRPVLELGAGKSEFLHSARQLDGDRGIIGELVEKFDAGFRLAQASADLRAAVADTGDKSQPGDDGALHSRQAAFSANPPFTATSISIPPTASKHPVGTRLRRVPNLAWMPYACTTRFAGKSRDPSETRPYQLDDRPQRPVQNGPLQSTTRDRRTISPSGCRLRPRRSASNPPRCALPRHSMRFRVHPGFQRPLGRTPA